MDDFSPMADPSAMGGYPMGGNDQNMNGGQDGMNAMGMDDDSKFESDFDPGVDADENSDPKKYIQQLCGKLSQSLRKYNRDLPQPDEELCKYVAGMILKQTTDGLTDGDKKDIIDKVNCKGNDSPDNSEDGGNEDASLMEDGGMDGQQPMMESINHKKLVNEIFQELTRKPDDRGCNIMQRPLRNVGFRKKPFTAPKMR